MAGEQNVIISKRLVAINSASSIAAKIVNMTVLLWMYQYLLKRIPAEEFAVLPVVMALMVFAPLFFSFFTGGISRYVVEAYAQGNFDRVTGIVSSIFPPLAAMALVFFSAGTMFAVNIDRLLTIVPEMVSQARIMMILLIGSFSLQMLGLPFGVGFHVRQRYVELNMLGVCRDFLRIVLLLLLLLGISPQVVWVVVATVVSEVLYTAIMVWRSRQMVPQLQMRWQFFDRVKARTLMGFGFWTTLGRLGNVMYTNAATILLNLYGTAIDVTSYHIGATFFRQIDNTVALAVQPLQPVMTSMHAVGDQQRLARTVFRGGRYATWASLAVAIPLTIYADPFVQLYLGEKYSQTAMVIVLFMLIFPFTKPTVLLAMTAMAKERVKAFFLPAFLFQLAGLGLMLLIVFRTDFGAVGMALSLAVITLASQLFYFWRLCMTLTETRFRDFRKNVLLPGFSPAIAGAIAWGGLAVLISPASWAGLIVCSVMGGVVYLAVLLGFCLSQSEKQELRAVLIRIRASRLTS